MACCQALAKVLVGQGEQINGGQIPILSLLHVSSHTQTSSRGRKASVKRPQRAARPQVHAGASRPPRQPTRAFALDQGFQRNTNQGGFFFKAGTTHGFCQQVVVQDPGGAHDGLPPQTRLRHSGSGSEHEFRLAKSRAIGPLNCSHRQSWLFVLPRLPKARMTTGALKLQPPSCQR